jgi:hypothetical protein
MRVVQIGDGDYLNISSQHSKYNFLLENEVSFWYENQMIDVDCRIMKETETGKYITNDIENNVDPITLEDYLVFSIIRNLEPREIKSIIYQISNRYND